MKTKKANSVKPTPSRKHHTPINLPVGAKAIISRLSRNAVKKDIMDSSHGVHKLVMQYNLPMEVIARISGICKSHIYNYNTIATLPAKIQHLIQSGKIAPTIALGVIRNIRNEKEMTDAISKHIANSESEKRTKKQKGSPTQVRKKMVSRISKIVTSEFDIKLNSMPKTFIKNLDKTLRDIQHQVSA